MMLGVGIGEQLVIAIVVLLPIFAVAYFLRLVVQFLRLSIAEMERGERVRKDREPEVAQVRQQVSVTLRERREACHMTQEFVAGQLGVSRQAVSKWETGASDPSTSNLVALARLYGVDPGELLRGLAPQGDASGE